MTDISKEAILEKLSSFCTGSKEQKLKALRGIIDHEEELDYCQGDDNDKVISKIYHSKNCVPYDNSLSLHSISFSLFA